MTTQGIKDLLVWNRPGILDTHEQWTQVSSVYLHGPITLGESFDIRDQSYDDVAGTVR